MSNKLPKQLKKPSTNHNGGSDDDDDDDANSDSDNGYYDSDNEEDDDDFYGGDPVNEETDVDDNKVKVDKDDEQEQEDDEEQVDDADEDADDEVVDEVVDENDDLVVESEKQLFSDDDSDNEYQEDDEPDEFYLQKFNSEMNNNYIKDFHPECTMNNYAEIMHLTRVVRDNKNNIIDDLHKTIPYLTKYERAKILGQRAKQINSGATPFVKVDEGVIDGYIIAEMELIQKRIPFIIRRPIPGNKCEYWNLKDLENIMF